MKANELRIGNYVYRQWDKMVKQQEGERTSLYQIENVNLQSALKYDPIPLTEEWLTKLGFAKNGGYWHNENCDSFELLPKGNNEYAV